MKAGFSPYHSSATIHIGATALLGVDVSSLPQIGVGQSPTSDGAYVAAVVANTPACPDQDEAIRKIREAVWTANAAVALNRS